MSGYVLGLAGSPRESGNSCLLLEAALDGVRETGVGAEAVILANLDISPCLECGGCDETGVCVLEDDMDYVYQKVREAAGMVVSSPIFFGHLPAQFKSVLDRFQAWWVSRYLLNKPVFEQKRPGALLVVGGMDRPDYFECIKKTIKAFFATSGFEYSFELYVPKIDEKGSILKKKDALREAFRIGNSLGERVKEKDREVKR